MEWLLPLVIGWILGQLGFILQKKVDRRRQKQSILEEVEEIVSNAERIVSSCRSSLEALNSGGKSVTIESSQSTICFSTFFPTAYLEFSSAERVAVRRFYDHVRDYNDTSQIGCESSEDMITVIRRKKVEILWAKEIGADLLERGPFNLTAKNNKEFFESIYEESRLDDSEGDR